LSFISHIEAGKIEKGGKQRGNGKRRERIAQIDIKIMPHLKIIKSYEYIINEIQIKRKKEYRFRINILKK
jgi:hypothetical protein